MQGAGVLTRSTFQSVDLLDRASGGVAPAITTASLPTGAVGEALSVQLAADGSVPITWSATGLPGWASLSSGGLLTGDRDTPGLWSIEFTATNGAGSDVATIDLLVPNEGGGTAEIEFGLYNATAAHVVDVVSALTVQAVATATVAQFMPAIDQNIRVGDLLTIVGGSDQVVDVVQSVVVDPVASADMGQTVPAATQSVVVGAVVTGQLAVPVASIAQSVLVQNLGPQNWAPSAIVFVVPAQVAQFIAEGRTVSFVVPEEE